MKRVGGSSGGRGRAHRVSSRARTASTIFRADGMTPRMTIGPPSTTVASSTRTLYSP